MTAREETQLAALEEIRCSNVKERMPGVWSLADEAIEGCKEIKNWPSEEDKRRYEHFKSILLDQKDRLTWREAKELFRLVSRSWGIE